MCTALTLVYDNLYFGRNMDLEYSFQSEVVTIPRKMPLNFKKVKTIDRHLGVAGMAFVVNEYPLLCDGVNEEGLCVAGLNFEGYACYNDEMNYSKTNLTSFEIPLYLLATCKNVDEAIYTLENTNIIKMNYSERLPFPSLHWIIADKNKSVVFEVTKDGAKIYENPIGVMTNNPPFEYHLQNLGNYLYISPKAGENVFAPLMDVNPVGIGISSFGVPGDFSSASKFIKTAYLKVNSKPSGSECQNVSQMFKILDSVAMVRGSVITSSGNLDATIYSSCMNGDKGIYYYKTYYNNQISAVHLYNEILSSFTRATN